MTPKTESSKSPKLGKQRSVAKRVQALFIEDCVNLRATLSGIADKRQTDVKKSVRTMTKFDVLD
jgi:hypothetical protein